MNIGYSSLNNTSLNGLQIINADEISTLSLITDNLTISDGMTVNNLTLITGSKIITDGKQISDVELGYLDNTTSNIQYQINTNANNISSNNSKVQNITSASPGQTVFSGNVSIDVLYDVYNLYFFDSSVQNTAYTNALNTKLTTTTLINSTNRLNANLIGGNGNISNIEYGYLNGATSNIQDQIITNVNDISMNNSNILINTNNITMNRYDIDLLLNKTINITNNSGKISLSNELEFTNLTYGKRNVSGVGVIQLKDINDFTNSNNGIIYVGNNNMVYDNNSLSGSHTFACNDASNNQLIPLTIKSEGIYFNDGSIQNSGFTNAIKTQSTTNTNDISNIKTKTDHITITPYTFETDLTLYSDTVSAELFNVYSNGIYFDNDSTLQHTAFSYTKDTQLTTNTNNIASLQAQINILQNQIAPIGSIINFTGVTIPTNYLSCNGNLISTTTYSALFAVCGYNFNNGRSPTTGNFYLPDCRGNFVSGSGSNGPSYYTINPAFKALGAVTQQSLQNHGHTYVEKYSTKTVDSGSTSTTMDILDRNAKTTDMFIPSTSTIASTSVITQPNNIALAFIIRCN